VGYITGTELPFGDVGPRMVKARNFPRGRVRPALQDGPAYLARRVRTGDAGFVVKPLVDLRPGLAVWIASCGFAGIGRSLQRRAVCHGI